jgi:hypothetical protein
MSEMRRGPNGAKKPAGIAPNGRRIQTQKSERNNYFCAHFGSSEHDRSPWQCQVLNSSLFKHLFNAAERRYLLLAVGRSGGLRSQGGV